MNASPFSTIDSTTTVDICVVGGAGHVGLPLALSFADKGRKVLIHDIDEAALKTIARGELPAIELGAEPLLKKALAAGTLLLTADPRHVGKAATVVVTVGTPVDEFLNPVHRGLKKCIDGLLPHLRDGTLLILRSTVYPGTTDWLARYLRDRGKNVGVAFCPERVVQGHAIRELAGMPQIVSGTTPEALREAKKLFLGVAPEVVELEPLEAEFAKLFNNAHRYISFAIANQFYMIADAAGVNYSRVLEAMTRNYPRAANMPGAGFAAGPCLVKDTMQLAAFAGNGFELGHAAMLVNEGLVLYLVERLQKDHPLAQMTVGLLGMAFKGNSDDTRASLSYKMKNALALKAKAVLTTDPLVKDDPDLKPLDEVVAKSDVLVLCAPHDAYRSVDLKGKPLVDIWNFRSRR